MKLDYYEPARGRVEQERGAALAQEAAERVVTREALRAYEEREGEVTREEAYEWFKLSRRERILREPSEWGFREVVEIPFDNLDEARGTIDAYRALDREASELSAWQWRKRSCIRMQALRGRINLVHLTIRATIGDMSAFWSDYEANPENNGITMTTTERLLAAEAYMKEWAEFSADHGSQD